MSDVTYLNKVRIKNLKKQPRLQWLNQTISFVRHRTAMLAHWTQINNKLKNKPEILTGKESCDMIQDLRHKNHLNLALSNVAEVYEIAEVIKIEFDYVMTEIARSNSFILQGESVSRVYLNEIRGCLILCKNLKNRARAIEKSKESYDRKAVGPPIAWVNDIVRCSFVCNDDKGIFDIFQSLLSSPSIRVVRVKNRFLNPTPSGYRDILLYARIGSNKQVISQSMMSSGVEQGDCAQFIVEIQIHHLEMFKFSNEQKSLQFYKYFRTFFGDAAHDPKVLHSKIISK